MIKKIYNGFCLGLFTLFFMANNAFGDLIMPEWDRQIKAERHNQDIYGLLTGFIFVVILWIISFFIIRHIKNTKK